MAPVTASTLYSATYPATLVSDTASSVPRGATASCEMRSGRLMTGSVSEDTCRRAPLAWSTANTSSTLGMKDEPIPTIRKRPSRVRASATSSNRPWFNGTVATAGPTSDKPPVCRSSANTLIVWFTSLEAYTKSRHGTDATRATPVRFFFF